MHLQLGTWSATQAFVPWLGIEPVTFWFTVWPSIHWATPARATYLLLEREEGREKGRERHPCARDTWIGCLLITPNWSPGPQPRHVPWPGIQPATFQFAGQHSIHWTTAVRAICYMFWNILWNFFYKILAWILLGFVFCFVLFLDRLCTVLESGLF